LHVTACEVRVLLSTVIRAVFSVTLSEPKHPAQDATTKTVTAAVTNRPPTAHLHSDSRLKRVLSSHAFSTSREALFESKCAWSAT
jgi:hypothetical protein